MAWSPSTPPKDRKFIAQDENEQVGEACFNPNINSYVWMASLSNMKPKFWQDFPKPLTPRDRYGAKIRQRSL